MSAVAVGEAAERQDRAAALTGTPSTSTRPCCRFVGITAGDRRVVVADVEAVEAGVAEHADAAYADAGSPTPGPRGSAADTRRELEQAVDVARGRQLADLLAVELTACRAFCTSTASSRR